MVKRGRDKNLSDTPRSKRINRRNDDFEKKMKSVEKNKNKRKLYTADHDIESDSSNDNTKTRAKKGNREEHGESPILKEDNSDDSSTSGGNSDSDNNKDQKQKDNNGSKYNHFEKMTHSEFDNKLENSRIIRQILETQKKILRN